MTAGDRPGPAGDGEGRVPPPEDEYAPLGGRPVDRRDLEEARRLFAAASAPYLAWPWGWLAWAVALPTAALLTPRAFAAQGGFGVLALWSTTVVAGGIVEGAGILRARRSGRPSGLGGWVLRAQGNLSLVGLLLSLALVWAEATALLPGLWLLLLGHSFYGYGGLAFAPFTACGVLYQVAGAVALWPLAGEPLVTFAVATAVGNLYMAWKVARRPG